MSRDPDGFLRGCAFCEKEAREKRVERRGRMGGGKQNPPPSAGVCGWGSRMEADKPSQRSFHREHRCHPV